MEKVDMALLEQIQALLAEIFEADAEEISVETQFGDLPKWDSMGHMEVMIVLEENFGVDIIFGLPGQTNQMLSADLNHLLELDPPHVSLYQLTIEEGTPLAARVAKNNIRLPQSEHMVTLFRNGHRKLMESGYTRYEVCSFAKPGHECRHNMGYWRGDDYLGLGPSAHSFINGRRYNNQSSLVDYVAALILPPNALAIALTNSTPSS